MDPDTYAYFNSAQRLKLKVAPSEPIQGISVQLGNRNYYFFDKITPINNSACTYMCLNRFTVSIVLKDANIKCPKAAWIYTYNFSREKLQTAIADLTFPLMIKRSIWTGKGPDLVCNIPDFESLYTQCELLLKEYDYVIVEDYYGHLNDYRILMFNKKIIDVLIRSPATIEGNGFDTIHQLIDIKNAQRTQKSDLLKPIVIDYETRLCLENQGLSIHSVLEEGRKINVTYTSNISRGADVKNYVGNICKENKDFFYSITNLFNIRYCCIDIRAKNLDRPINNDNSVIVEVNDTPNVCLHESGIGGAKKMITMMVMKSLIFKHPFSYFFHLLNIYKHYIFYALLFILAIILPSLVLLFETHHHH